MTPHDPGQLRGMGRQATAGLVFTAGGSLVSKVISLGKFLLLARLLTPEDFGLMAAAGVISAAMIFITEQGLGPAVLQRAELDPVHIDTAFWAQVGTSIAACAAGMALAPWFASLYQRPELTLVIQTLLLSLPLAAMNVMPRVLLERQLQYGALTQRSLIGVILSGALALAFALAGAGVWSLVVQQVSAALIDTVLLFRLNPWRPRWRFEYRAFRQLLPFSIGIFLTRGSGFLQSRALHFIIGLYLGPVPLGLYVVAERMLDSGSTIVAGSVARLTVALFSRLQNAPSALATAYERALLAAVAVGVPTSVTLAMLGTDLTVLAAGRQWYGVGPIMTVMAGLLLLRCLGAVSSSAILAQGRSILRAGAAAVAAALIVLLAWVFVERGVVLVVTLELLVSLLVSPVLLWVSATLVGVGLRAHLSVLALPLTAGLAMAGAMWVLRSRVPLGPLAVVVGVTAVAGWGVFFGVMWALSGRFRSLARVGYSVVAERINARDTA